MFSGEYQASLDLYSEFLTDTNSNTSEWYLKKMCLRMLIDRFDIKAQTRQTSLAITYADSSIYDENNIENGLHQALGYDLLCGLAWFNLGLVKFNEAELSEASFCFTLCSLTQPWDVEAWVNATILSFNTEVPLEVLISIIQTAYLYNRDEYLEALYDELEKQSKGKSLDELSSIIEEIITHQDEVKHPPKLRLLDDDGKFKDISNIKKN